MLNHDKVFHIFVGFVLFSLVAVTSVAFNFYQHAKISEQAITLDIWKNCLMPRPGWWLIVEADWLGKLPTEQLRCGFARQPVTPQKTY